MNEHPLAHVLMSAQVRRGGAHQSHRQGRRAAPAIPRACRGAVARGVLISPGVARGSAKGERRGARKIHRRAAHASGGGEKS
jgi:hypothetical protein